jgi:hypothetical protein
MDGGPDVLDGAVQAFVRGYLESLKEPPPAQGGSLGINKVLESMMKNQKGQ